MDYLHRMGIAHGDLRGNNILLSEDDEALVTDVFLYAYFGDSDLRKDSPERWMSPEFLDTFKPTYASDSFSFGHVCIEIFTGEIPFPELSVGQAVGKMAEGIFPIKPDTMPDRVWSLVREFWEYVPERRPTMQRILRELSGN
ncbi:hypothetical protein QCA50_007934 [Cerrena zonata]|uniref:Protein kinase domain-containing protein n=1 Tax=Cerrena zonata TaxID=2478898 RepID=A0AAW0G6E7_9APHY